LEDGVAAKSSPSRPANNDWYSNLCGHDSILPCKPGLPFSRGNQ
jgi:hypothetical protein